MKNLWRAMKMIRQCDRWSFWRRVFYVILGSLLPLITLYVVKVLVDSVTSGSSDKEWVGWLLAVACVFLFGRVISALDRVNGDVLSQKLIDFVSDIMQRQSARLDMECFDSPSYHDTYHRAQQEASTRPITILNGFMSLGGSLVTIIGIMTLWLMAGGGWSMLLVMIVAILPGFVLRIYKAKSIYAFHKDSTQLHRRSTYYNALLTARDPAKEVRAYGLKRLFRNRFVETRQTLVTKLLGISRRLGVLDVLCAIVEAAAMFVVVGVLAKGAVDGVLTIGAFVMLLGAFRRGQSGMQSLVTAVAALYDSRLFVGNLFDFLSIEPKILSPNVSAPMPERIEVVELRDVTFRYPGMQHDVLHHYSLKARCGEITRISGENGSGKSTVVKLLLRLYDPQEGAVLINGIDVRRFSLDELRSHVVAVFQEFTKFNLPLEENITLGLQERAESGKRNMVEELIDFEKDLPQGWQTQLGRLFGGGSELSMGQWQRIAISRMLATDAPVMVLDEPYAWLDPHARRILADIMERMKDEKIIIVFDHVQ